MTGPHSASLVWVGSVAPRDLKDLEGAVSLAGVRYQDGLVTALVDQGVDVELVGVPTTPTWGRGGRLWVSRVTVHSQAGLRSRAIGFPNIVGLKQVWIAISLFLRVLLITRSLRLRRHDHHVVVFNTISYIAIPVMLVSLITRSRTVGLIADVPLESSRTHRAGYVRLESRLEIWAISQFSRIVVLSQHVARDFGRVGQPWMVIEGGVSHNEWVGKDHAVPDPYGTRRVVFAGTLNEVSGIELALEAMTLPAAMGCELQIFGSGPLLDVVKEASSRTPGICYMGSVPHVEVMNAYGGAALLISPRAPDDYVTRYTFPSKILEYLGTGIPVLANRLEGMPDAYDSLLNFADPNPRAWSESIGEICNDVQGEYRAKAQAALEYVRVNRNWMAQASRLSRFLAEDWVTEKGGDGRD